MFGGGSGGERDLSFCMWSVKEEASYKAALPFGYPFSQYYSSLS